MPSVVLDPNPRIIIPCCNSANDGDELLLGKQQRQLNHQNYAGDVQESLTVLPYALYGDGVDLTNRSDEVGETIRNCSFIVGMHPDQATEAIVDTALRLDVHFAVVPCCVMPSLFPHRRQRNGSGDPVRSYSSFCQYLLDKSSDIITDGGSGGKTRKNFQMVSLSFVGRNKVIFSIPSSGEVNGFSTQNCGNKLC